MNLVPPLRVLEDKAKVVADALLARKLIVEGDYDPVFGVILSGLRYGGRFQLLEDGPTIQVKTVIRDESGKVIGAQG